MLLLKIEPWEISSFSYIFPIPRATFLFLPPRGAYAAYGIYK